MSGYNTYQKKRVEGSGRLGLVLLSYEVLYKSLAGARTAIESGDLMAEAKHTSRAMESLIELASTLDMEKGGNIAHGLASLYSYMMNRLTANLCTGSAEAVKEVMHLVEKLREGWQSLNEQQQSSGSVDDRFESHQAESSSHASMAVSCNG